MKKAVKFLLWSMFVLVAIVCLTIAGLYVSGNGYVVRAFGATYLKGHSTAYIDDHGNFENHTIHANHLKPWRYHEKYNRISLTDTLRTELESYESVGFGLVKDGQFLYEEYWDGYSDKSQTNVFSVAKSVTTLLLGKAIEQGFVKSLDQPIVDFLPEFQSDSLAQLCTVGDLSAMTSGFDWDESYYSPFSPTTESYFGDDIEKMMLKRRFNRNPGTHFEYLSGNTQLLGILLVRATGKTISEYATEVLWKPMGMEHDALWSVSSGLEKTFCCLHTNVRDLARLGQLLLQKGCWEGTQLIDSAFVECMVTPNYKAFAPDEPKKYGYSIWIDEKHQPAFYAMLGHLGQRIIVVPSENLVIVRLGKTFDNRPLGKGHLDTDIYYYVDETVAMLKHL